MKKFKPDILMISVTMSFNVLKVKDIISSIKNDNEISNIKVMVGLAFNDFSNIWSSIGADGFATNVKEAKSIANKWGQN